MSTKSINSQVDFKDKILSKYSSLVSPYNFYRDIFPLGVMEEKGKYEKGKYNGIALEIFNDDSGRVKRHLVLDDLDKIKELCLSKNFIVIAPITYMGKRRRNVDAMYLNALAFDLDGVTEKKYLVDLLYQMGIIKNKKRFTPVPTYIVNSGNGIHVYYVFNEPIFINGWVYEDLTKQLNLMKGHLTRRIWNIYTSSLADIQYQSISQGFRMVGSLTKDGRVTTAYKVGDKVDIPYLNTFIGEEECKVSIFDNESYRQFKKKEGRLTLSEAKEKYPDWYERRIINKEPRKNNWKVKKELYNWWFNKISDPEKTAKRTIGPTVGHRYFCVMILAIFARKCGVSYEELERDAYSLEKLLDSITKEKINHFTKKDIDVALRNYKENFVTYSRVQIEDLSAIRIDANKRNGRKQEDHLKVMRAIRDVNMEIKGKDWRNNNGRPKGSGSKERLVKDYLKENPMAKIEDLVKDLNVNKKTAYKYYPKTDKKALIKDYIKSHPNDSITSIARALNISRPTVYKYR